MPRAKKTGLDELIAFVRRHPRVRGDYVYGVRVGDIVNQGKRLQLAKRVADGKR